MTLETISPAELQKLLVTKPALQLIDVRTPVEYREVHLVQAQNFPLDRLNHNAWRGMHTPEDPLYVICQSGTRARQACTTLAAAGIPVILVEGGTRACIAAGLDVVRGRKAISLERQVRITAGALVLTGSALAWFVHPAWIGLSAFIGAGLLFSGISDTCGMGMILARMPWNQVTNAPACDPKTA